ncbi:CHAT domain-containing protein [Hypoxylon trugodes]|uniref:CHAT domain-containing protein n=1 Tax=Hypoxylon trugodes TaxID=326681 RepID=UPI0021942190|nr:CHAT domain-containing protein [Hypoxylon trugodes]KAI1385984.1 CHAT domain-containing protein [Hypoxylon trugodes]
MMDISSEYERPSAFFDSLSVDALNQFLRRWLGSSIKDAGLRVSLSRARRSLFVKENRIDDINEAIVLAQLAVDNTPDHHPKLRSRKQEVLQFMAQRFCTTWSQEHCDEYVSTAMNVKGSRELVTEMSSLSNDPGESFLASRMHEILYNQNYATDDLNRSIAFARDAVRKTSSEHLKRGYIMTHLSACLQASFDKKNEWEVIKEALSLAHAALELTPKGHPDRPRCLGTLAAWCHTYYRIDEDSEPNIEELNIAVNLAKESVATISQDDDNTPARLTGLAEILLSRVDLTGSRKDLEEAIENAERATSISPPDTSSAFFQLARARFKLYEKTENFQDLQAAVEKGREAVKDIPQNHPDYVVRAIGLTKYLHCLSEWTQQLGPIQEAFDLAIAVINITPKTSAGYPYHVLCLALFSLGRAKINGSLEDTENTIKSLKELLGELPPGHHLQSDCLANLSTAYRQLFENQGDLSEAKYLDEAVDYARSALSISSTKGLPSNSNATILAGCLSARFVKGKNPEDIEEAIRLVRGAISTTSHTVENVRNHINCINLAAYLQKKAEATGKNDDLDEAIKESKRLLDNIPAEYSSRFALEDNLASSLLRRNKSKQDQEAAIALRTKVANSSEVPCHYRIRSALLASEAIVELPNEPFQRTWTRIYDLMEKCVKLLPQLSRPTLAASAALLADKGPVRALELLEQSRGILADLRWGARTDLSRLNELHPQLAGDFKKLQEELDTPSVNFMAQSIAQVNERRVAGQKFEEILSTIRGQEGFGQFLLPPPPPRGEELKAAASNGPVIVINVSQIKCDAFIIERSGIRTLHLESLKYEEIEKYVKIITSIRKDSARTPSRGKPLEILEWLWDTTVGPVLNYLSLTKPIPEGKPLPRVWWVPTDILSFLPLHAAGYHRPNAQGRRNTAMDSVVSSYSPSVKALLHIRSTYASSDLPNPHFAANKALLNSMAVTPGGYSDLRFAEEEAEGAYEILRPHITSLHIRTPMKDDIMGILKTFTIWHFAGHGEPCTSDPSKSALLLKDGEENPLTFTDLVSLKSQSTETWLAYLSACSTGDNPVTKLQNETVHLISACQLAGFRHAIGSLWEVSDQYSADVAKTFYAAIINDGRLSDNGIAYALHAATKALRDTFIQAGKERRKEKERERKAQIYEQKIPPATEDVEEDMEGLEGDPFVWAAYMHVGP